MNTNVMTFKLPDNVFTVVICEPLHRYHSRGGIYRRPSDWIAYTSTVTARGSTRREALAQLMKMTGGVRHVRH
jgi:hypothetical protein